MKSICAWCKKSLSPDSPGMPDGPISHGLCPDCAHSLFAEAGLPLRQFLDQWACPILVLDAAGVVQTGNAEARRLRRFLPQEDATLLPGDVLECAYAKMPERCGHTVHCAGCAIRYALNHTQQTGEPVSRTPAHLRVSLKGTPATLLVSTEKAGEHILLRLEPVNPKAPDHA